MCFLIRVVGAVRKFQKGKIIKTRLLPQHKTRIFFRNTVNKEAQGIYNTQRNEIHRTFMKLSRCVHASGLRCYVNVLKRRLTILRITTLRGKN